MNNIDRKIIRTLSIDGRLSNSKLAQTVGLSPSQCWQRLRRLENEGLIEGYTARLNQAALGAPEMVIVEVSLDKHDDRALEAFENAVQGIPEIVEAYLTSGEFDYLLKVAVSDTRGFQTFLKKQLYPISGIRHSRSSFTLGCIKKASYFIP